MDIELKISGDIIDIRDGTHDSPTYVNDGYPLITSKNLKNGKIVLEDVNLISKADFDSINKRSKVDKGDILYSMIGTIGNFSIIEDDPVYAIKNVALFKFNKNGVYNKYFFYLLSSNFVKQQIEIQQKGGTQKFVTLKILRNLKIPLPPLKTQQRIAQILDDAAALRDNTKQLLTEYDLLAQSIFLEMFGDPYHNPKNFELVRINYFIDKLESGRSVNSSNEVYTIDHAGVLKTSCVYNGVFEPSEAKVIVENEIELAKLNPKKDSIIISRMNTEELVGKSAYVHKDYENLYLPDRLWQSVKTSNEHSVLWLSYAIGQSSFMSSISRVATGTSGSMKNVSQKKFLNLEIINPPIELQNQFAEKIALIEQQKELAKQELQESEDLFNSLLQKAFKGELVQQL